MKRFLRIQQLEKREMLHADTNLDNVITAADALTVINHLGEPALYSNYNVNGDDRISVLDALVVVNQIYREQNVPPARTVTFQLGNITTFGLTRDQVLWAIKESLYEYEKVANLKMQIVASGGQFTISSGELYLGNKGYPFGSHARGWVIPGLGGRTIQFHNGRLSAGQHIGTICPANQNCNWSAFGGDPGRLKTVNQHEVIHAPFALPHSNDSNCVAHVDANENDFCPAEVSFFKARYK